MKTVSAIYLRHLFDACIEHGADTRELCEYLPGEMTMLQTNTARFPVQCVFDILAHTAKNTKIAAIGLLTGKSLRPTAFGDVGHAIMLCKSLRQVILINRRYQPLTQQIGRSNLKIMEGKAWLSWECGVSDPEYYKHITEAVMANHVQFGRWLSWVHNKKIETMHFRHQQPEYVDEYAKLFECPVYFGQNQDAMVFEAPAIDMPLPQPNEQMLQEVCARLDIALNGLDTPSTVQEKLTNVITNALAFGAPNLERAAKSLGMSGRSLRRSLQQENTTYRAVLEKTRQDICEHLMTEHQLSLANIASQLGYSEQSAFNRAFKSWYGQSPKAYMGSIQTLNTAFDQLAF